jgi:hypothetical protein
MTALGSAIRADADQLDEARQVARETMKRARANVELLVDRLPELGFEFEAAPLVPPSADVRSRLDDLEASAGVFPISLRVWLQEIGQVNLNGRHAGWNFDFPDPLVVDAELDYVASEHELWLSDKGTEWERGPVFEVELAPDYLHKANVSGGAPYSVAVPNEGVDGFLLWERHQTTFVNYLRIAFTTAGMPGWQRGPALLDDWALPQHAPPAELIELALKLSPI